MEYGYSYEVEDEPPTKPPPEDVAQGLRIAILTRLQHYRQLWLGTTHRPPRTGSPPDTSRAQLQMIQAALLQDIRNLARFTARLEKKLDRKKWIKWIVNPLLPILMQYLYLQLYKLPKFSAFTPQRERNDRGQYRPAYLTVLSLVPWFAGPAALWRLFTYEEQVDRTARLQETLEGMEEQVDRGLPVRDIGCLELSKWEDIRWHPELFPL
ncbi:unnamed protein product [Clonostachys rosea]|uniref:Peroxisomal membrane protein PEX16 n=1 Tax=Bionectria ochroleuca TaxID=29856 RepID=A0ABY6U7R2_BIOOC|nr:unnamed protein product [Clonostachys rosea]